MDWQHLRNKYKDRMLHVAFIVSGWSAQPEGQRHGCVLAVNGKFIVSTGFNGPDRKWKLPGNPPMVHAEGNAIINARMVKADLRRCVAYVTKKPCEPCFRMLKNAGVLGAFWLQENTAGGYEVWTQLTGQRAAG